MVSQICSDKRVAVGGRGIVNVRNICHIYFCYPTFYNFHMLLMIYFRIYGFSWPKYLGGPMYYANKIGLDKVYQRICYYHEHLRKYILSRICNFHWIVRLKHWTWNCPQKKSLTWLKFKHVLGMTFILMINFVCGMVYWIIKIICWFSPGTLISHTPI